MERRLEGKRRQRMSVGRDVIADVAKVPESHVRCSTCIAYNSEYDYCEGWEQSAKPSDFCSFWADEEKHSYWGSEEGGCGWT